MELNDKFLKAQKFLLLVYYFMFVKTDTSVDGFKPGIYEFPRAYESLENLIKIQVIFQEL